MRKFAMVVVVAFWAIPACAAQTISQIGLSNTSVVVGAPAHTYVGEICVVMASLFPKFYGALMLTGTNANQFVIEGTSLYTSPIMPASPTTLSINIVAISDQASPAAAKQ